MTLPSKDTLMAAAIFIAGLAVAFLFVRWYAGENGLDQHHENTR